MRIGLEAALSQAGARLAEALKEGETIDAEELLVTLIDHTNYTLRGYGRTIERSRIAPPDTLTVKRIP